MPSSIESDVEANSHNKPNIIWSGPYLDGHLSIAKVPNDDSRLFFSLETIDSFGISDFNGVVHILKDALPTEIVELSLLEISRLYLEAMLEEKNDASRAGFKPN